MATTYDTSQTAAATPEPTVQGTGGPTAYQPEHVQIDIPPAPTPKLFQDYENNDGKTVTIFSSTTKPQLPEDFDKAMDQYGRTGDVPNNFTLVTNPVLATIRKGFETGAAPIRQATEAAGESTGKILASPGNALFQLGEKAGLLPSGSAQGITNTGARFGKAAGNIAATPLRTPEELGGTVGVGTAAALMAKASYPAQIAATMLGNVAGRMTGGMLAGSQQEATSTIIGSALSAGFTHGAIGAFKYATGKGLSQQAQEGVDKDLVDMIAKKHPSLVNDPNALPAVMSTKAGIADVIQIGVKGLRGDIDTASNAVITELESRLPKAYGAGFQFSIPVRNNIRNSIKEITAQQNKIMDNIGDGSILKEATDTIKDEGNKIGKIVYDEFVKIAGGTSPAASTLANMQSSKVLGVLNDYKNQAKQFEDGAKLYSAIRQASEDGSFNVAKFQKVMANLYTDQPSSIPPGSLMRGAYDIAGRNGPGINQPGGVDLQRSILEPFGIKSKPSGIPNGPAQAMGWFKTLLTTPKMNTYAGNVPYNRPIPNAAATISGYDAVRAYLSRDNRKQ